MVKLQPIQEHLSGLQERVRHEVHETRHQYRAIMVGVDTVIKDNPSLTCRLPGGSDPIRIICDSHLRSPLDSNVIKTAQEVLTWLATTSQHQKRKSFVRKFRLSNNFVQKKKMGRLI